MPSTQRRSASRKKARPSSSLNSWKIEFWTQLGDSLYCLKTKYLPVKVGDVIMVTTSSSVAAEFSVEKIYIHVIEMVVEVNLTAQNKDVALLAVKKNKWRKKWLRF